MPGDWMSVSTIPTLWPSAASRVARLAAVLDLPVPPRKEWTEMIFDIIPAPKLRGARGGSRDGTGCGSPGGSTLFEIRLQPGMGIDYIKFRIAASPLFV